MPISDYLAGLAFLVPTLGAVAAAAIVVARRRYGDLRGAELVCCIGLLTTAMLLAAHVIPLAIGALSRGTVLVSALAILGTSALIPPRLSPAAPRREPAPSGRLAMYLAAAGVAAVVVYQLGRLRLLAPLPFTDVDVLNFHLPGVARWIQSGSLWQIDQLFPFFVTGNYPNNGDVLTLATVLPWRDAAFARLVEAPFLALTGVAVYALGRELGAARATAALVAAAVTLVPAVSDYALEGLPDVVMLFGFVTGILFLARNCRTGSRADLVLAGLGLGLAFGAKWYGVTSVAAAIAAWIAVSLLQRHGLSRVIARATALGALILLVGGIWLLRNAVESGNPLFPQEIAVAGLTLFPGPDGAILERVGFTIAGYLDDPSVLKQYIVPGLWRELGLTGLLCGAALLAALAGFASSRWRDAEPGGRAAIVGVALTAALTCILYAITPGSAFGSENRPIEAFTTVRWLTPAVLLAGAILAAGARPPWLRRIVELAALAAIADGLLRAPDLPATFLVQAGLAVAAAVALAWLGYRARPAGWSRSRRLLGAATAAAAVAIMLGIAGRLHQQSFDRHGYDSVDPTLAVFEEEAHPGLAVALAGTWDNAGVSPAFPAFGPRLANRVEYVGPVVQELLRQHTDRREFLTAIEAGGYDLLLVGRAEPPEPAADEEAWARSAGYRRIAASPRLALYEPATEEAR